MRRLFAVVVLSLVAASAFSGCSPFHYSPAPREIVQQSLDPILALEQRFNVVVNRINAAFSQGQLPKDRIEGLKRNFDLYAVYHQAAMVSLAHGQMADYKEFVELALAEVAMMELAFAKPT